MSAIDTIAVCATASSSPWTRAGVTPATFLEFSLGSLSQTQVQDRRERSRAYKLGVVRVISPPPLRSYWPVDAANFLSHHDSPGDLPGVLPRQALADIHTVVPRLAHRTRLRQKGAGWLQHIPPTLAVAGVRAPCFAMNSSQAADVRKLMKPYPTLHLACPIPT
jgi:hypothetical protein